MKSTKQNRKILKKKKNQQQHSGINNKQLTLNEFKGKCKENQLTVLFFVGVVGVRGDDAERR